MNIVGKSLNSLLFEQTMQTSVQLNRFYFFILCAFLTIALFLINFIHIAAGIQTLITLEKDFSSANPTAFLEAVYASIDLNQCDSSLIGLAIESPTVLKVYAFSKVVFFNLTTIADNGTLIARVSLTSFKAQYVRLKIDESTSTSKSVLPVAAGASEGAFSVLFIVIAVFVFRKHRKSAVLVL